MSDGRGLRFGTVAEHYDRFRPSPPFEAVELLGALAGRDVLEVAAGTGKWTRLLVEIGAYVTVVEPDDSMRAVLVRQSPDVRALAGRAEALPVDDDSFNAVLVVSAWHWFDDLLATSEMARVLRDDGELWILGNSLRRGVDWISSLASLREKTDGAVCGHQSGLEYATRGPFTDVTPVSIDWSRSMSSEDLVGLFSTFSEALAQGLDDRIALDEEMRRHLLEIAPSGVLDVPMTLSGFVTRRRRR